MMMEFGQALGLLFMGIYMQKERKMLDETQCYTLIRSNS